jgi:hypothetical protein
LKNYKGVTSIPKDWILKSHADQHFAKPEPRAGKPLIIAPDTAGDLITFKANNGQVIASARKGDLYKENRPGKPKRYIYRINDGYGYLLSEKAIRISGSPIVQIRTNGKNVGSCNLAFRDGTFHG